MPIEIKELIIKVNVEEPQRVSSREEIEQAIDKEEIIKECIDRIKSEIEYLLGS
jgi:hypothetical protein